MRNEYVLTTYVNWKIFLLAYVERRFCWLLCQCHTNTTRSIVMSVNGNASFASLYRQYKNANYRKRITSPRPQSTLKGMRTVIKLRILYHYK